jgi:hypothetical protein
MKAKKRLKRLDKLMSNSKGEGSGRQGTRVSKEN